MTPTDFRAWKARLEGGIAMRKQDKSHFPLAVYVATFADGSKARLSFGRRRKDGSPDADKGRGFVDLLYCTERKTLCLGGFSTTEKTMGNRHKQWQVRFYTPRDGNHLIETPGHKPKPAIVDGWIEFKGQTYRDPHFAGEQATVSQQQAKRVSAKQALRQLLEAIETAARDQAQTHVLAAALEQARKLAA